ncbi:hypothetical protein V8G54_028109 [Vigna mungo]|uniref:Uncharacterized protein n=1 Tax=Vigna mungo TaxID=3915 RepID=A0AAQ3RHV7_VIGMU
MAEEKREGVEKETMSPWEQHAAVINLPRFDYNAPSSLLRNSHSGFLITCTLSSVTSSLSSFSHSFTFPFHFRHFLFLFAKREKSATKEAIAILRKFVEPGHFDYSNNLNENSISKRRKLIDDAGEECLDSKETESATADSRDGIQFIYFFSATSHSVSSISVHFYVYSDQSQTLLHKF